MDFILRGPLSSQYIQPCLGLLSCRPLVLQELVLLVPETTGIGENAVDVLEFTEWSMIAPEISGSKRDDVLLMIAEEGRRREAFFCKSVISYLLDLGSRAGTGQESGD